jgi:hypothetical protein
MRPLFAERPEISVKVARDPPIQAWGRACLPLVRLCHAVLAVKASREERARERRGSRGGLDGCAAAWP